MSALIELSRLTPSVVHTVKEECTARKKAHMYQLTKKFLYLPIRFGHVLELGDVFASVHNEESVSYPHVFTGTLRPLQQEVMKDALKQLNHRFSCLISMATGMGKTITSICIACKYQAKTVIVVNREVLWNQWRESIAKVTNSKICMVRNNELDPDAGFYITSPHYLAKRKEELQQVCSVMIVDEAHSVCTPKAVEALLGLVPNFLIGLTATPDQRVRDLEVIEMMYAKRGEFITKYIEDSKIEYRILETQIPIPLYLYSKSSWWGVLNAQAFNRMRNAMIANLCKTHYDRSIIVFGKRIDQLKQISFFLQEEDHQILDANSVLDLSKRIVLTTFGKGGVGMDRPNTDMLVFASDVVELFQQYVGRCLRRQDGNPIIYDIVDCSSTLQSHCKTREEYIASIKGSINHHQAIMTDTLVILAAGSSSRYTTNVPKQLDPIGPDSKPMMFYSIRNALRCGIRNVIVVTKPEYEKDLHDIIPSFQDYCYCGSQGSFQCSECIQFSSLMKTCFCNFHSCEDCVKPPKKREKNDSSPRIKVTCECDISPCTCFPPELSFVFQTEARGTVDALAQVHTSSNVIVINADDYYSIEAFEDAMTLNVHENIGGLVTFELHNTLFSSNPVNRGVCIVENPNGPSILQKIVETKLDYEHENVPVSMNMWVFTPFMLDLLREKNKDGYLLPTFIQDNLDTLQILTVPTPSSCFGITFPEDKAWVHEKLCKEV